MADKKSILATYLEFLDDLNKQLKKIPSLDPEKYNCPFPVSQTTFKEVTTAIIKIEIEPSYNLLKKEIRILNIFLQQLIINGYRPPKKEISKAIIPTLTVLSEQIKTLLEYWKSHKKRAETLYEGGAVEKILICGEGARLKGLTNFLTEQLKIPVQLGNPWVNIIKTLVGETPYLNFEKSLGYTTALGLALRGARKL